MQVKFHHLTISGVQPETQNAIAITFDVPEELKPLFLYKSGQFLTVKAVINGVEHRRNYSLCSSPVLDEPMRIAVKKVKDGAVSQWLNEHAAPGMTLEVYPPMGNFTKEFSPSNVRHYVMFAGGSGITPILSIVKSALRIEPHSVVTLVYANTNADSIIFDEALQQLAANSESRLRLVHVLENNESERASYAGRMDKELVHTILSDKVPNYDAVEAFVCGPGPMMDNVVSVLHDKGLADNHIHREYFTIDKHKSEQDAMNQSADAAVSEEIKTRRVKIRLYGQEHEFDVEPDETILSAAQRADLDPPYACQIGACCTCRAKIVSGKVKMDEREALSDDEINEGYALTCQSHPLTDGVFADYDQ